MIFDYSKLRGKIKEVYGTEGKFALALGLGRVSLSKRLNNELEFSQNEMFESCDLLGVPYEYIRPYFFTVKVQEHELEEN